MKFLTFAALGLALSFSSALEVDKRKALVSNPATCPDPRSATPLYRSYSSSRADHFYTTNLTEHISYITTLGYTDQGIAGYIFPTQGPNTVPLFRLWQPSDYDHYYTPTPQGRLDALNIWGYKDDGPGGIAGYVYNTATAVACSGLEFWMLYSDGLRDHFYTASITERDLFIQQGYRQLSRSDDAYISHIDISLLRAYTDITE